MNSPISRLTPDILLKVFELIGRDCDATLVTFILCFKMWRPLAESVLYGDTFLNAHRLTKFLDTYTDRQIRSLTLAIGAIPVNPYDSTLAVQTAAARLEALQRLGSHIKKMAFISLSITIDFPFPYTASLELSSIVNNPPDSFAPAWTLIPNTAASSSTLGRTLTASLHHMCATPSAPSFLDSSTSAYVVHNCFALFGIKSHEQDAGFEAVRATNLKSCLINLYSPRTFQEWLKYLVCQ
jgi:hypothetical protein